MSLSVEILANRRFPVSDPIEVPGWTGLTEPLHLRTLTAADQDRLDKKATDPDLEGFRALFAALVLCDAKGKRVFSDASIHQLNGMPGRQLSWILDAGRTFNGTTDDDEDEIEGNSSAPADGSGSVSPSTGE